LSYDPEEISSGIISKTGRFGVKRRHAEFINNRRFQN